MGIIYWTIVPHLVSYLWWQPQGFTSYVLETFQIENLLLYMFELLIKYLKCDKERRSWNEFWWSGSDGEEKERLQRRRHL